jgi:cytochrome c oxidase cbb3-type subunit II
VNNPPLLFLGILFTMAISFAGLILAPQMQIGHQVLVEDKATGSLYPIQRTGDAAKGEQVYRCLGCAECHTRQVRAAYFGTDLKRGWGKRFTVAQDYLRDYPVMLGNLRMGPDLADVGARQPDPEWHMAHLYKPTLTTPGSLMPRYRSLFVERKLNPGQAPSAQALQLDYDKTGGNEVLKTDDARNLAAYLASLRTEVSLFESPVPAAQTNAPPVGGTNAPAGDTNAAAAATNAAPATNAPASGPGK